MILMALAVFVENIERPSGTRLCFPLFPAQNAPGYCRSSLRDANSTSIPMRRLIYSVVHDLHSRFKSAASRR